MRYVWLLGGVLTRLVDDSAGRASRIAFLIKMYEIYIRRLKDVWRRPLEQRRYIARAELRFKSLVILTSRRNSLK